MTIPALSFGVELEILFAFHEELLAAHLSQTNPSARIVKTLTAEQERSLRQRQYPHLRYGSWALANTGTTNPGTIEPSVGSDAGPLRAYLNEALEMAQAVLSSKNVQSTVWSPEDCSKPSAFEEGTWHVTADKTLQALSEADLHTAIGKLPLASNVAYTHKTNTMTHLWDSAGVELVSPPFTHIEHAASSLSTLLAPLQNPKTTDHKHAVTVNRSCGLHVHVGRPDGTALPLLALQNLAYLLVIYESEISRMHAPWRRNCSEEIISNRDEFLAECPEPVARRVWNKDRNEWETRLFEPVMIPLEQIQKRLFDNVKAAGDEGSKVLKKAICGGVKSRIVNFAYIDRENGPKTVEFRQLAGTTDITEIIQWVEFCTGLVELACRYAAAGRRCEIQSWDDRIRVEDLFEKMGMNVVNRHWWAKRIESWECHLETPPPTEYFLDFISWDEEEDALCSGSECCL